MGVILWYRLAFPTLGLTVSNDVSGGLVLSDAEITVTYGLGHAGDFTVHLASLPVAAHRALSDALGGKRGDLAGAVPVEITLGYLESPGSRKPVLKGRVDSLTVSRRFPPLGVLLTGYEEAAFRLLDTKEIGNRASPTGLAHLDLPDKTPVETAKTIAEAAKVTLVADAPGLPGVGAPAADHRKDVNMDAANAFALLEQLARRHHAEVLVQDGTVWFGPAVTAPASGPGPALPPDPSALLAFLTREDTLIVPALQATTRLAAFAPVQAATAGKHRISHDLPKQTSVGAFDFTVLGLPALRAGQLVAASVDGYQNPFRNYRIIRLTHSFSPREGYVCTGRAALFTPEGDNRKNTEAAREGSPVTVADAITGRIQDSRTTSPSVDVGRVGAAEPARRTVDLSYGQAEAPDLASPSVGLTVGEDGPKLRAKPLAAPFAWHKVGLCVPVYPGMRALLNEVRTSREDTVVAGFLWADEPDTERPDARAGDWWLCLPTRLTPGPDPRPDGPGVNDLTTADGRRVIEAVGLKMTVGLAACSPVGTRPPAEGGADEFLLRHASGTEVRIDPTGNVTVGTSSGTVTVTAGQASLKLAGATATLSAGGVTVTLDKGKVAIS
ncbi:hypothetical protein ACFVHB_28570 [Kitasatospora sp. NPDC127111]|uniref:hypothetical protein n=1 Tax=Kitasatospora sp. NPDC127111 TaxID=3345363 RepID=UPI003636E9B9